MCEYNRWEVILWDFGSLCYYQIYSVLGKSTDAVGGWVGALCLIQCVVLIGCIIPVEKALKKTFDNDGNRREAL